MNGPTIRKYRPEDKEALRHVCRETAGEYFRKNERMLNAVPVIYSDYFTENEPDNIFVAADENDRAIGYIECSSDSARFRRLMPRRYMTKAVKMSPAMLPCAIGYFIAWLYAGKKNRTHLHIDLLPECQRMGVGTKLIDEMRRHLAAKGKKALCVNTMRRSESAYGFYRKYGFRENVHFFGDMYSLTIPTEMKEKGEDK